MAVYPSVLTGRLDHARTPATDGTAPGHGRTFWESDMTDTTDERWLPVFGWEGLYEVSDQGRVRSPRGLLKTAKRGAYRNLRLSNKGYRRTRLVHRLVLEAFVGVRPDGMEACHNNGTGSDNRLVNLRWDTRSSNRLDAVRHGTNSGASKTCCPQGHPYDADNTYVYHARRGQNRQCRICKREAVRRLRSSRKANLK